MGTNHSTASTDTMFCTRFHQPADKTMNSSGDSTLNESASDAGDTALGKITMAKPAATATAPQIFDRRCLTDSKLSTEYIRMLQQPNSVPQIARAHLKMIAAAWEYVCNDSEVDVGIELFRAILKRSTQIQRVFMIGMADYDNLSKNGRIISHAAIVKTSLTSVLAHFTARLADDTTAAPSDAATLGYVRSLGARHVYVRPTGFTPDLWFPFADGLASLVNGWPVSIYHRRQIKAVWLKLVCFIIVNMRYGYNQAVLERDLHSMGSQPNALPLAEAVSDSNLRKSSTTQCSTPLDAADQHRRLSIPNNL